jgi:hypothetical protein
MLQGAPATKQPPCTSVELQEPYRHDRQGSKDAVWRTQRHRRGASGAAPKGMKTGKNGHNGGLSKWIRSEMPRFPLCRNENRTENPDGRRLG